MRWKAELEAGKLAYDRGLYAEAIRRVRAILDSSPSGAAQTWSVQARVQLAQALRRSGQYDACLEETRLALTECSERHGRKSSQFAQALEELGLVYMEQSKFAESEQALLQALDIRRTHFKSDHPAVAETLNDLGLLYWSEGEDAQAEKYYQQALVIRRKVARKNQPAYAETVDNLGVVYQRMDRLAEAEILHREALAIRESSQGKEHPDVGYSLVNLAEVCRRKGDVQEVEQLVRRAIEIWEKTLGDEHPHTAVAINNLGGIYLELEQFDQAAPLFERAMAIMEKSFGRNHPALLINLHNLSTLYRRQRRRDDARKMDNRIQDLMQKKLDGKTGTNIQNLLLRARSLQSDRDFEGATKALLEALEITEADFGVDSQRAAKILDFLGSNSLKQNDLTNAREYFNRALAIKKLARDPDDADIDLMATEQNLLFLSKLQADPELAKLFFGSDLASPSTGQRTTLRLLASEVHPLNLKKYKRIVVLTGAGISVASGLRPYRGPNGAWEEADTARVSDISIIDDDPPAVWNYFGPLREQIAAALPNAAHKALADCELARNPDESFVLITQNIDGLHQRAGSQNVVELHGSVARTRCSNATCRREPYLDSQFHTDTVPLCQLCGKLLRPDIVFFGEAIPVAAGHAAKRALRDCDLFIAIGTSGMVAPACDFVRWAKYADARTLLVNLEPLEMPVSAYDEEIIGRAEEILPRLLGS